MMKDEVVAAGDEVVTPLPDVVTPVVYVVDLHFHVRRTQLLTPLTMVRNNLQLLTIPYLDSPVLNLDFLKRKRDVKRIVDLPNLQIKF